MFEILVTLCLSAQPEHCHSRWMAGGAAEQIQVCRDQAEIAHSSIKERFADPEYTLSVDCRSRPQSSLDFTEVASGVFVHRGLVENPQSGSSGDIANMGFIVGNEHVLAVDSGGSYQTGEDLYFAIRQRTDLPVSYLVLTHMHPDHVFGAGMLSDAGAKIIGHKNLSAALADRFVSYTGNYGKRLDAAVARGIQMPKVDLTVDLGKPLDIDLGDRVVRLEAWQSAHTNNDLSVHDLHSRIMFVGDLLFDRHIPVIDGSVRGWLAVMDGIDSREVRSLIPGHGGPLLPATKGFASQRRYFNQLIDDATEAVNNGVRLNKAMTHIGEEERDRWLLFDDFNKRNAAQVYSTVEWE